MLHGTRLEFFGLAPWVVQLLVFRALAARADAPLALAAVVCGLFAMVAAYLVFALVRVPDRYGKKARDCLNPLSWPSFERSRLVREHLVMVVVAGALFLLAHVFGQGQGTGG